MKVPEPRKKPNGKWLVQLRLGGQSYSFTKDTKAECIKAARTFKADYLAGRQIQELEEKAAEKKPTTLRELFDAYLTDKDSTLSPSTIRFYRIVQKNRFQSIMDSDPLQLTREEWQHEVNVSSKQYAPKTVKNSFTAVKTVVHVQTGVTLPDVSFPGTIVNQKAFLTPQEIPLFIAAAKDTKYAVPLLLALSSMRISEIDALDWRDIPPDPDFIVVKGARVLNESNDYVSKRQAKNESSSRPVPILIPELSAAIKRDRQPVGPVMPCTQNNLRIACHRVCKKAGVTDVSVHGLRHSFASLCYSLQIPEQIVMDIGGWKDIGTMRKIYTHIAQQDIDRYKKAIAGFFDAKQSAENAS